MSGVEFDQVYLSFFFKQPSLKKFMQRPALAPCSRKRGQKAPNWNQRTISSYDGTQRLPTSYKLLHFTKPGKLGLWGRRRSSRRCRWSKEPLHSSSPLEEFSPKIKNVFFAAKNRLFLNLNGELGEGWRNVARPEPSSVPAQSTHQILRWDWPE